MALLGPATTSVGSGNVLRSSVSSVASYTIKKQTGRSPIEHVSAFVEKNNSNKKRKMCKFLNPQTQKSVLPLKTG